MFSFASSKLRASKHGNFSSIDSWSSSERMFAKDGYNERWYRTSECTYNTVVEMNHPETQSNDSTDSKSAVYSRHVHQKSSNHLLFNNNCSSRTLSLSVTTMWLFVKLLTFNVYVYIDVITWRTPFFFITHSNFSSVISDAPFAGIQLINQSISVVNFTSLHSKHAHYMQHKTIITD